MITSLAWETATRAAQLPTWPKGHSQLKKSVQSLRGHGSLLLVIAVAFVAFPKRHTLFASPGPPGGARG